MGEVGEQARNRRSRADPASINAVELPYDIDVGASSLPPAPPSRPRDISNLETTAVSPSPDEPPTVRTGPGSRVSVRTGEIVAGKFRVERVLGEGGMGVVVAATHMQLRKPVALKFLRGDLRTNGQVVARFANEARAAAKLKSEHVAHVLDVGEHDDGTPFMVLEHLTGRDLGQVISEVGQIPVATAAEYLVQACDGVAEAHARGIVHRDIKPENLFLVEQDGWHHVKILDFGISKAAIAAPEDTPSPESGKAQTIMGSPCYMSPEQIAMDEAVDHRSDIWALGAVLFELLTGVTPFEANQSLHALMLGILHDPPRSLEKLRPGVPPELVEVVGRCLEKDRRRRFQNAAELAIALLPFAPRRARVPAERALSVTKAAGLAAESAIFPASIPPGPSGPPISDESLPALVLKPAPVPRFDELPTRTSAPTVLAAYSEPTLPPESLREETASRKKIALRVAAAAAVVALAGLAFVLRGRAAPDTHVAAAPIAAPQGAPAAPVGPRFAQLRVESTPPGASVREDGVEVCASTPCLLTFQGEAALPEHAHQLVVSRAGYAPRLRTARLVEGTVAVELERLVVPSHTEHHAEAAKAAPEPERAAPSAVPAPPPSSEGKPASSGEAPPPVDGFKELPY